MIMMRLLPMIYRIRMCKLNVLSMHAKFPTPGGESAGDIDPVAPLFPTQRGRNRTLRSVKRVGVEFITSNIVVICGSTT